MRPSGKLFPIVLASFAFGTVATVASSIRIDRTWIGNKPQGGEKATGFVCQISDKAKHETGSTNPNSIDKLIADGFECEHFTGENDPYYWVCKSPDYVDQDYYRDRLRKRYGCYTITVLIAKNEGNTAVCSLWDEFGFLDVAKSKFGLTCGDSTDPHYDKICAKPEWDEAEFEGWVNDWCANAEVPEPQF